MDVVNISDDSLSSDQTCTPALAVEKLNHANLANFEGLKKSHIKEEELSEMFSNWNIVYDKECGTSVTIDGNTRVKISRKPKTNLTTTTKKKLKHKNTSCLNLRMFYTKGKPKSVADLPCGSTSSPGNNLSTSKNSSSQFTQLKSHINSLDDVAACKLYEDELSTFFDDKSYLISNDVLVNAHCDVRNKITAHELSFPIDLLDEKLAPARDKFYKHVVMHNETVLLSKYGIENFEKLGYKTFLFEICISRGTQRSENLIDFFLSEVHNSIDSLINVYHGEGDLWVWIRQTLGSLENDFLELQKFLYDCVDRFEEDAKFIHNTSENCNSNPIQTSDAKFHEAARRGENLINDYFSMQFNMVERIQDLGNELALLFVKYLDSFMTQTVETKLFSPETLNQLYNDVESFLLTNFADSLKMIFDHEFQKMSDTWGYNGQMKDCNKLPAVTHLMEFQQKRGTEFACSLFKDVFRNISDRNKTNVKKTYDECFKLVEKGNHAFESAIIDGISDEKSFSYSQEGYAKLYLRELSSAREKLKVGLNGLKYSVKLGHILSHFDKQCESASNVILSLITHKFKNNIPCSTDKDLPVKEPEKPGFNQVESKSFVIDLNFWRMEIVSSDFSHENTTSKIFKFLPSFLITESGVIVSGDSNVLKKGHQGDLLYHLKSILDPNDLYKAYPCYVNGELAPKTRIDLIVSLFLAEIKQIIERELCIKWDTVAITVPLRFTMGQRYIMKQAAAMAGFLSCILINNTSAAAVDAFLTRKLNSKRQMFVAIKSDGVFDSAIYCLDSATRSSPAQVVRMMHSYCNIPENLSDSWLIEQKLRGKIQGKNWTLISCAMSFKKLTCSKGRNICTCVLNIKQDDIGWSGNVEYGETDVGSSILFGACFILSSMENSGRQPYVLQECIPYAIISVTGSETRCIFQKKSNFESQVEHKISASKFWNAKIIEVWNHCHRIICNIEVDVQNASQFLIKYSLDSAGLLNESFSLIGKRTNAQLQTPRLSYVWEEPKLTENHLTAIISQGNSKSIDSKGILTIIRGVKDFITSVEPRIASVGNVVQKKFLSDALTALKDEIASRNCTENSIQIQYDKLNELLKKFNVV
ncbi:uncharacterized protein LOC110847873 [Folsomia candida]|nr:uncharacterized protein LOC110847873 [Folsomia candida]XP_035705293.1 uncharacterized protein LOC110847873 [Folsomia candida]